MNYTILKGDTLGTVAQKFLGSSTKWRDVWAANPQISNPDVLRVGQIITVPATTKALVPVTQPVIKPVVQPSVQVSSGIADKIKAILQDRKMLIILSIGLVGVAYMMTQRKTKKLA